MDRVFVPESKRWLPASAPTRGTDVSLTEAVSWLQRESRFPWRPPVGLIGPREPTPQQARMAETVGAGVARLGLTLICGGHRGAMEAACRGAAGEGGLSIGLLPDAHWEMANPFVTVPIATGIGIARNAVIARAAFCLVAVGGGYGTLSEMAFGLQFGRPVFGLAGAPALGGVEYRDGWADVEAAICRLVLNLA
jgi:uncharacterized protein (TIGR00725 family)